MLDTLHQYLYSLEWQKSVEMFVSSNCKAFSQIDDYTHDQFILWEEFRELAEQVLECGLQDVGGSMKELEIELDVIAREAAKGPKDAVMKDILNQLLTFDNFNSFAKMMYNAFIEMNHITLHADNAECKQTTTDRKLYVAKSVPVHAPSQLDLDQRVDDLISMGFPEDLTRLVVFNTRHDAELHELVTVLSGMQEGRKEVLDDWTINEEELTEGNNLETFSTPEMNRDFSTSFALYVNDDPYELTAKEAIAKSVIELITNGSVEKGPVAMLKWASGLVKLLEEARTCYLFYTLSENPHKSSSSRIFEEWICEKTSNAQTLSDWYDYLEIQRKYAQDLNNNCGVLSDLEQRKLADLERIAAEGSEREQLVHSLIARHTKLQNNIDELHQRVGQLVSNDGIKRTQLEEFYLFLKEHISSGEDLEDLVANIFERAKTIITIKNSEDTINLLLEMHLFEDEQLLIKSRIEDLMNEIEDSSAIKQFEMNVRDIAPISHLQIRNDAIVNDYKETAEDEELKINTVQKLHEEELHALKEKLMAQLKDDHKDGLLHLKQALAISRAKRVGNLQMQLREMKDVEKKVAEDELNKLTQIVQDEEDGITAGYKRRCIMETKHLKQMLANATSEDAVVNYMLPNNDKSKQLIIQFSQTKIDDIKADAVRALIERYHVERRKLLHSLQNERDLRRQRLTNRLCLKKGVSTHALSDADLGLVEKEVVIEENAVLNLSMRPHLLSIAAAGIMNPVELKHSTHQTRSSSDMFVENEEEYFEAFSQKDSEIIDKKLEEWINNCKTAANTYSTVSVQVQQAFTANFGLFDLKDGTAANEVNSAALFVQDILIRALSAELNTLTVDDKIYSKTDRVLNSKHLENLRKNIMEQFYEEKLKLEDYLHDQQVNCKEKLTEKRKQKSIKKENDGSNQQCYLSSHSVDVLDKLVDDILKKPLAVNSDTAHVQLINIYEDPKIVEVSTKTHPLYKSSIGESKTVISEYEKHHQKLNNFLQMQMEDHKEALQRRLKSLQQQRNRRDEKGVKEAHEEDDEILSLREQLQAITKRYEDLVCMLNEAGDMDVKAIKPELLIDYLQQPSTCESVDCDRLTLFPSDFSCAPFIRNKFMASRNLDMEQAKKISSEYSTEQEKLDLLMKLQQTRQRQVMQRKLLERKQSQQPNVVSLSKSNYTADSKDGQFTNAKPRAPPGVYINANLERGLSQRGLSQLNIRK